MSGLPSAAEFDHQPVMRRLLKRTIKWWYNHRTIRTGLMVFTVTLVCYSQLKTAGVDDEPEENANNLPHETQEPTTERQLEAVNNRSVLDVDDEQGNKSTKLYNVRLKRIIDRLNDRQTIRNLDRYGPLTDDSLIVVIQVHTRINYLNATINSLSEARGIEDVLLIFSHDFYDPRINRLIKRIHFCKTLQIFFPFSVQVYADTFPGRSPNDCPEDITRDEAIKMNCKNAKYPDQFGHYRNANITQIKHHWWWKVNTVFDGLKAAKSYSGLVIFIEEDHYMVEDFIHILKLMQKTCQESKIFSLGEHTNKFLERNPEVHLSNWISNLGMAFSRNVWNELVRCADKFCYFDDYNWDWSLQKMTKNCPGHTFRTATLQDSRVLHIGECGIHHQHNCTDMSHVVKMKNNLRSIKLYPETLDVTVSWYNQEVASGNGGWGDPRDHKLCMNMTIQNSVIN